MSGVYYETDSLSGWTSPEGAFYYEPGEAVRFSLGATPLGEVEGASLVSPFDLVGIEPITSGYEGVRDAGLSFDRVVNLLVLLETFDRDGDPSTGIELSEPVSALFAAEAVNLDQSHRGFRTDRVFRQMLNQANADSLFDEHRAPRGPAPALNRLYDELGLETGFFANAEYEADEDGDGAADRRTRAEFDADGFPTRVFSSAVSEPDHETRFWVNEWAEMAKITQDTGADGLVESSTTSTFDRDGNRILDEFDWDGDGRPDGRTELRYDGRGRRIEERPDRDGDGAPDSIIQWSYDDLAYSQTTRTDTDGDGTVDEISTRYSTEAGETLRFELDQDGDGTADRVYRYRYDERGNQVLTSVDENGDGVVDRASTYSYDEGGQLTRVTLDDNDDGIPSSVTSYRYDEERRQVSHEMDDDADGVIDSVVTTEYLDAEHSPFGARTRLVKRDTDNDGRIDSQTAHVYDENDFRTMEFVDEDGDSIAERVTRYTPLMVGWGLFFWD